MKPTKTLLLLIIISLLIACESEEEAFPSDPGMLFPNTSELDIKVLKNNADDRLYFDLNEVASDLLFIGIFEEMPQVLDGALANEDALVWSWEGAADRASVYLDEGLMENTDIDILNQPECVGQDLFWAAWGWVGNAKVLRYSTPVRDFDLAVDDLPDVRFVSYQLLEGGDENQDGYIAPGEEVNLQLVFTNQGQSTATATRVELSNVDLEGLPALIVLDDIAVGQTLAKNISFTVPSDSEWGDLLNIGIKSTYNDCLVREESFEVKVDGINVCLEAITVTDILYLPPLVLWDPAAILPIFYAPDMYNVLIMPNGEEAIRSMTIQDAAADHILGTDVLAEWPAYDPCVPLQLDEEYTFQVWDEDALDDDDYIGEYTFRPVDYLNTQDTLLSLQTELISFELRFKWGN